MNNVLMDPEQCCSLFAFWYALDIWKRRRTPDYYLPEPDRPFTGRGGGGGGPVNVAAVQNDPEQEASRSEIINDRSIQDPASPETESTGEAAGKSAGGGDGSKKNSSEPSVRLNFILSMAYQVLVVILPMITAPYVARVLGADKIGIAGVPNSSGKSN